MDEATDNNDNYDDDTIAAGLSTSQDSTTDSFTSDPNSASSSDVAVGQIVIAPFKGNKYFRARILSYREKRFFKINFDDGTTSEYVIRRETMLPSCLSLMRRMCMSVCNRIRHSQINAYNA